MAHIFLVTSGIHGGYGVFEPSVRIEQTLQTAASIRQRVKDCRIMLLEGGAQPLSQSEYDCLRQQYDQILDYTSDPVIQFAHRAHRDEVISLKGPCEARMLAQACVVLQPPTEGRVFKISGRYCLSDQFDLDRHLAHAGKYVFLTVQPGERYDRPHAATPWQYKTRLYSWCRSLWPAATRIYKQQFENIVASYQQGVFIDIEHTTYRTISPQIIETIDPIGVQGPAASGTWIQE